MASLSASFPRDQSRVRGKLAMYTTPMLKQAQQIHRLTLQHNDIHSPLASDSTKVGTDLPHLHESAGRPGRVEGDVVKEQHAAAQPKGASYELAPAEVGSRCSTARTSRAGTISKAKTIRPVWQVKDGELVCVDPIRRRHLHRRPVQLVRTSSSNSRWGWRKQRHHVSLTDEGGALGRPAPKFSWKTINGAGPATLRLALRALPTGGRSEDRQTIDATKPPANGHDPHYHLSREMRALREMIVKICGIRSRSEIFKTTRREEQFGSMSFREV